MLNQKIIDSIKSQFTKERFLFWYDTEKEYLECISSLALEGVRLVMTDTSAALAIKLEIAQSEASTRFLFYSNNPEPERKFDWLLSYRLKGKSFSADATQIQLDELGLSSHTLRPYLKKRAKYLAAKDRVEKLKRIVEHGDTAELLDLKILSILTRSEQLDAFAILNQVILSLLQDDEVDFNQASKVWSDIENYQMEEAFWLLMKAQFGYQLDAPTIKNLILKLWVTDFATSLKDPTSVPQRISHFVLTDIASRANAKVFLSRWRNDVRLIGGYIAISRQLGEELDMQNNLHTLSTKDLLPVQTFEEVEREILGRIKSVVLSEQMDAGALEIINLRKDGFWANSALLNDSDILKAYAASYRALEAAIRFFSLKAEYASGFSFNDASAGLNAYKNALYQFDQSYRQFHFSSEQVEHLGWKLLKDLVDKIEDAYSGWFIPQLSSAWSNLLEGELGLLKNWRADGWVNQYRFYKDYVKPLFSGQTKRVFVLISDAFRFEASQELAQSLSFRNKFQTQLDAMLGVLPSYTSLGMAALLPHEKLKYKVGQSVSVLADELSTSGLEQRAQVLAKFNGTAVKYDDLLNMGKDGAREFVKPFEVVYIYHDRVDATGDKQGTETKTFEAVDKSIAELSKIVSFLFNNLAASTVFVTADHGFMYQESALESADKSQLIEKPQQACITKKRYLLGSGIGSSPQAWCGNTAITGNTVKGEGSLDFWLPKGGSRFHFTGGARFVHGSAMPQEIVVPVIIVKQKESERAKTKFVDVQLLGQVLKVVTNMQRFDLMQTESISDYVLPRTLKLSIQDGHQPISDEQTITFDKSGSMLDDLKVSTLITLKSGDYDRSKVYYFVAKDITSEMEVIRQPIKIDLSFSNDF